MKNLNDDRAIVHEEWVVAKLPSLIVDTYNDYAKNQDYIKGRRFYGNGGIKIKLMFCRSLATAWYLRKAFRRSGKTGDSLRCGSFQASLQVFNNVVLMR